MKLASINHPEILVIESTIDEDLRKKLLAGLLGAGIAAGGIVGGLGGKSANTSGPATATQSQNQNDEFWTTGVTNDGKGGILVQELGESRGEAEARANQALASYLGADSIPPGVSSKVREQNGIWKATLNWSKSSEGQAQDTANSMQDSNIIQNY